MKVKLLLFGILFVLSGSSVLAQKKKQNQSTSDLQVATNELTLDQKIESILEITGQVKTIHDWIMTEHLNPARLNSDYIDKEAVSKLLHETSTFEITKKLTTVYKKYFTPAEIETIYQFSISPAGKKYLKNLDKLTDLFKSSLDSTIQNIQLYNNPITGVKAVHSADRPDGFYLVTNYSTDVLNIADYKLAKTPSISVKDIHSAKESIVKEYGAMVVIDIVLTPEGAAKFEKVTSENIGHPIAIVVDDMILSAPIINSAIPGGKVQIAGNLSMEEAKRIVKKINSQLVK